MNIYKTERSDGKCEDLLDLKDLIQRACFQCKATSALCQCPRDSSGVSARIIAGQMYPGGMYLSKKSMFTPFAAWTLQIQQERLHWSKSAVVFLIDTSISMSGVWPSVIQTTQELVNNCPPQTTCVVCEFACGAEIAAGPFQFNDGDPQSTERTLANQLIGQMNCSGLGTNFRAAYDQVDEVCTSLSTDDPNLKITLVLVTDGDNTFGPGLEDHQTFKVKPNVEVLGLCLGNQTVQKAVRRYVGDGSPVFCWDPANPLGTELPDVLNRLTTAVKAQLGFPSVRLEFTGISPQMKARISGSGSDSVFVIGKSPRKETVLLECISDWDSEISNLIKGAQVRVVNTANNQELALLELGEIPGGGDADFLKRRLQALIMELETDPRKAGATLGSEIGTVNGKNTWNEDQAVCEYMKLATEFNLNYAHNQLNRYLDELKGELGKAAKLVVAPRGVDFGEKQKYLPRRPRSVANPTTRKKLKL